MTERDIKYENGDFWVYRCNRGYTVFRAVTKMMAVQRLNLSP